MLNAAASASRKVLTITLLLFAVECGFYSIWPLWRILFPIEIALNEGWNAYHADAAMGKDALYPPAGSLISNNYPPLSYYLVGTMSLVFGDAITVGRILSIGSTLAIAAIIGLCIRQLNGSKFAALLGGLWFLGTMVRYADWYVAMNDPHLLALALMCVALATTPARRHSRWASLGLWSYWVIPLLGIRCSCGRLSWRGPQETRSRCVTR